MSEAGPATEVLFMRQALEQAQRAADAGEVPVGAVVVHQGRVIGRGHNRSLGQHDVTAHAEIQAIREASRALGNYRLDDCQLYVTLEPCVMCSGAILAARFSQLVYGASEPKTGAAGSVLDLFSQPQLNHHTQVQGGLLAGECSALLQAFFQDRRQDQQVAREKSFLRDDALRAPASVQPDWPAGLRSVFLNDLPALQGHRLHVLRAGEGARTLVLALHDPAHWSAAWAAAGQALAGAGLALLAPDLVGFGLSDKPKKAGWHSLARHAAVLQELIERQPEAQVLMVAPKSLEGLARQVAAHPKVSRAFTVDEPGLEDALAQAPYPTRSHCTGPQTLPDLLARPPQAPPWVHLADDWVAQLVAMGYSAP